jgi:phage-related protein/DNA-binding XRE family transcriptional regulator
MNPEAQAELNALPADARASFERIVRLVQAFGLERVHEPYIKHIEGPIWEMRLRERAGIARALYVTATGRRVVILRVFTKKTQKTPRREIELCTPACRGSDMSRKMIPVEESFAAWRKDPEYEKAYNALEDEFSLAASLIEARARAGLTQQQLAERMNTTQAVIARLESGRVKPSTRTLERLAAATGLRLRISFEPAKQ